MSFRPTLLQGISAELLVGRNFVPICVFRDRLLFMNGRCAALFGYPDDDVPKGFSLRDVVVAEDRPRVAQTLREAMTNPDARVSIRFGAVRVDGSVADLELVGTVVAGGGEACIVAVASDITERLRDAARLNHLAFYDGLTGLANRTLFFDRLRQCLLASRRTGDGFALLACDLDGFKAVNDTYGHEAGDKVLQAAAAMLRSCCREVDTAARIGGDEFALLLPGIADPNDAALVASRVIFALAEPIALDGHACCVGVSVGIALFPRDGETIDTLVRSADAAMYAAKAAGRNCSSFADPGKRDGRASNLNSIVWSEVHELGIGMVDAQHRKLAALIGRVGAEFAAGHDATTLRASLAELAAFAHAHFAAEEALMDRFDIADRAAHKQAHRRLLQDLESLLDGPGEASMMVTMSFLHEWLLHHVESADRALARQLLAKGYTDAGRSGARTTYATS